MTCAFSPRNTGTSRVSSGPKAAAHSGTRKVQWPASLHFSGHPPVIWRTGKRRTKGTGLGSLWGGALRTPLTPPHPTPPHHAPILSPPTPTPPSPHPKQEAPCGGASLQGLSSLPARASWTPIEEDESICTPGYSQPNVSQKSCVYL